MVSSKRNPQLNATSLIHHDYVAPADFKAPQVGVYKASSVIFPSVAEMHERRWQDRSAYTYGLHGTPTTFTLEARLAHLEGARHCLLAPSGLSALALVNQALLSHADHVLIPDNAYGPLLSMFKGQFKRWGLEFDRYDPMDLEDFASRLRPHTRLVWLEAPGSVSMEFPDLKRLVSLCKSKGIWCALDNTWGAGLAFKPFDLNAQANLGEPGLDEVLGVDVSVHALTKYPSGGADLLMGSVVTQDQVLFQRLSQCHEQMGIGVGANDVESVLKGLQSLALRYDAQDQAARALAHFLSEHDAVAQVLHPALSGSPGHANWQALTCSPQRPMGRAAGIFSVIFESRYTRSAVHAFCEHLKLFQLAYSWGGPMSWVMPYDLSSMRALSRAHLKAGELVRFCVGLEDVQDLQNDLAQALRALTS